MTADQKELQFIASRISQAEGSVRWWCMREDLQQEYLRKATDTVEAWYQAEVETEQRTIRDAGF